MPAVRGRLDAAIIKYREEPNEVNKTVLLEAQFAYHTAAMKRIAYEIMPSKRVEL